MALAIDITLPRRAFDLRLTLKLGTETLAVLGPSGSGKTSLLKAVAGLERPTSGHIALDSETWCDADRRINVPPERRRVGYLPQDYGLFPHLTVARNVRFAGRRDRPDLLQRLGIEHLADARPQGLSGGERQRVALARALARDPQVLLLDEPFAALDTITRHSVRDELAEILTQLRLPTLLVTHAFDDASVLAHRIAVIDHGRLVQLATAHDLLHAPATALVAALTGANILDGTATPTSTGSTIRLHGGGHLTSATPATGQVQIAIHPWELQLTDPDTSSITDTVLSTSHQHGTQVIRLSRFSVHTTPHTNGTGPPQPGSTVGVHTHPHNVRILAPNPRPSDLPS